MCPLALPRRHKENVSRIRVLCVVGAAVATAVVISLLRGDFWTISLLCETVFWIAVFAALSFLNDFFARKRRPKGV